MKPYYEDSKAGIVIYHGDCRGLLSLLPSIDFVLTDPPYNIKHTDGGGIARTRDFYGDGKGLEWLSDFLISDYKDVLTLAPTLVMFCSRDGIGPSWQFISEAFDTFDMHFWHKTNPVPFTHSTWLSDVEYIPMGWNKGTKHLKTHVSGKSKVYTSGIETENMHPTQKPVSLMSKYINVIDGLILDPFAGSCTTARAAKNLGRRCICIEKEERYCEIGARRLQQEVLPLC